MLKEAMLALRVTDMEYAPDIKRLLIAGKKDLEIAGVTITGDIVITITEDEQTGVITATDSSTITDDLVITALITYCRTNFGSPADYDRLAASYDLQRRQLANATGYTDFGGETEESAAGTDQTTETAEAVEAGADA